MAGKIHHMIEEIVNKRAKGNATLMITTKTKLMLKGINPEAFDESTPDDPAVIEKLAGIAHDLGVVVA
jgi:hypothetical protein